VDYFLRTSERKKETEREREREREREKEPSRERIATSREILPARLVERVEKWHVLFTELSLGNYVCIIIRGGKYRSVALST